MKPSTSLVPLFFLVATIFPRAAAAVTSAELYTASSYQYGRFEARVRFAPGDGVVTSFFLWKDGSEVAGTFWNELDFEKLGADCHLETNAFFGNPGAVHVQRHAQVTGICTDFHTYAYEWTPEYIAWFVDDAEIRRETGATALAYADNATAGMQIRFNIWPGDASFGGNFSPSILPVAQHIDWVEYSIYANGAFTLDWRDDFDGDVLASRWLTGSWASPKNLSQHDARNVSVVDGNAVLSLTNGQAGNSGAGASQGGAGVGGAGAMPGATPAASGGEGCRLNPGRPGGSSVALLFAVVASAAAMRRRARQGLCGC